MALPGGRPQSRVFLSLTAHDSRAHVSRAFLGFWDDSGSLVLPVVLLEQRLLPNQKLNTARG